MKLNLGFLLLGTVFLSVGEVSSLRAQTKTEYLEGGGFQMKSVEIPEGSVCEILTFLAVKDRDIAPGNDGATGLTIGNILYAIDGVNLPRNLIVAGPITFYFSATGGAVLTYRISENGRAVPPDNEAMSSRVEVAADAKGPVEIILESSSDLKTWVPARLGKLRGSTSRRVFRLRAVQPKAENSR